MKLPSITNFCAKDQKLIRQANAEHMKKYRAKLKRFLVNPIKTGTRDKVREEVRIRDKRTCQNCGKVWKEGMRRFDVHHLDEEMEGKSGEHGIVKWDREHMDRMITYCHKCHLSLDSVRNKMKLASARRLSLSPDSKVKAKKPL